eukprot:Gb_21958 [translate_table: standard]
MSTSIEHSTEVLESRSLAPPQLSSPKSQVLIHKGFASTNPSQFYTYNVLIVVMHLQATITRSLKGPTIIIIAIFRINVLASKLSPFLELSLIEDEGCEALLGFHRRVATSSMEGRGSFISKEGGYGGLRGLAFLFVFMAACTSLFVRRFGFGSFHVHSHFSVRDLAIRRQFFQVARGPIGRLLCGRTKGFGVTGGDGPIGHYSV